MENLVEQLESGFKKVTPEIYRKIIKKVRTTEDAFWEGDAKLDEDKENLIA